MPAGAKKTSALTEQEGAKGCVVMVPAAGGGSAVKKAAAVIVPAGNALDT